MKFNKLTSLCAFVVMSCFLISGCYTSDNSGSTTTPISSAPTSLTLAPSSTVTVTLTNHLNVLTDFTIVTADTLSGLSLNPTSCSNVAPNGGSCIITATTNSSATGNGNIVVRNSKGNLLNIPAQISQP